VSCPDGAEVADVGDLLEEQSDTVAAILAGNPPPPDPVCGNGVIETGEECDANELGGATCAGELPNLACAAGALTCSASCTLDVSACTTDAECTSHCFDYAVLDSASRHVSVVNQTVFCDQGNQDDFTGPGWYRIDGAAGVRMPETAPVELACGTHAPGWLNGSHPAVSEGIADRQVCFSYFGDQCVWSTGVKVLNCGDYYVYELPDTPECSLRYCGENPPL
jgi:hypothetical protein